MNVNEEMKLATQQETTGSLSNDTQVLKKLNESLSTENCQLKEKINDLEAKLKQEMKSSSESIESLRADRKRLRCEKFDLLNQTKELYEIIESKENEIRDFLRHYELKTKETSTAVKKLIESKAKMEKERDELKAQVSQLLEEKSQRVAIIENKDEIIGKLQKQLYEIKTKSIRHSFGKDSDPGYSSSKSRDTLSSSINEPKVLETAPEKQRVESSLLSACSKYSKSKKEERMLKSKSSYDHQSHQVLAKAVNNNSSMIVAAVAAADSDDKLHPAAKKSHSLFVKNDKIVKSKSTSSNDTTPRSVAEISCIMNKSFLRENPFEFDDLNEVLDSEEFVDLDTDEAVKPQPRHPPVSVAVAVAVKSSLDSKKTTTTIKSASSGTKRKPPIRQSMSSDCIIDDNDGNSMAATESNNFISLTAQVNNKPNDKKECKQSYLYHASTMSFSNSDGKSSSHSSAMSTTSGSSAATGDGAIGSSISPSVSVTSSSNLMLNHEKSSDNDNDEVHVDVMQTVVAGSSSLLNSSSSNTSSSSSTASPVLMNQSLTICENDNDDESSRIGNKSSNELMYSHYVPSQSSKTPKHSLSVSMNVQSSSLTTTSTNSNSRSSKILNSIIKISSAASATSQKVFSGNHTITHAAPSSSLSSSTTSNSSSKGGHRNQHQANSTFSTLSSSSKSSSSYHDHDHQQQPPINDYNRTISGPVESSWSSNSISSYSKRPGVAASRNHDDQHFQHHIAGSCVGLGCLKMIGDLKNSSSLMEYNVAAVARSPCMLGNGNNNFQPSPNDTHAEAWSSANIKVWLEKLGFQSNQIKSALKYLRCGKDLLSLSESDFERVFLINTGLLHKRKLRLAIEELKLPEKCKYAKIGEIRNDWVCKIWLNEIGLVQYRDAFKSNLVDGRVLNSLQKKDLEKYLNINKRHHQTSILLAIDLLRRHEFDVEKLERQRALSSSSSSSSNDEFSQMEIQYWKNEHFVDWLELVNLQASLDGLSESGLHGALVADSCFNVDFLYSLMGVSGGDESTPRYANMKKILEDEIKLLRKTTTAAATTNGKSSGSFKNDSVFLRPLTSFKTDKRIFTFRGSLGRALGRKVKRDISSPLIDDQTYKRIECSHKIVDMRELKNGLAL